MSKGYAIVTKRGRIRMDTICLTKEEVKFFYSEDNKERGEKICQVYATAKPPEKKREKILQKALKSAKQLFDEALPKFNWGKSALDANAIRLLNEVPGEVSRALEELKR